jgi:hypothetical protein
MLIEQCARQYRANSSFFGAVVGKFARGFIRVTNTARVVRYDALLRPPFVKIATGQPRLFPVCFSCGKHFSFLRIALLSLGKTNVPIGEISIFMDRSGPLSQEQQEILREESKYPISFSTTAYPMRHWGPKVILSSAIAYRSVAEKMSNRDFLMKFDSDVIFRSGNFITAVLNGKFSPPRATLPGAVGTPVSFHRVGAQDDAYMQGGCYFVRGIDLFKILSVRLGRSVFKRTKWGAIAEDQFFSELLSGVGTDIHYEDYLYSEPIFVQPDTKKSDLEAKLKSLPDKAEALHFEGNQEDKVDRSNMAPTYIFFYGENHTERIVSQNRKTRPATLESRGR